MDFSELRNKYFYRTESWDWLNEEEIHVVDSKRPRVITMDPWTQKIYLEALGQLTVEQYINQVTKEYPKNEAPKELQSQIMEILGDLVYTEKIISLSDKPVTIDKSILNPPIQEGDIDLKGVWNGTYEYNLPEEFKDDKLKNVKFELTIETTKGNTFTGTVKDDLETGGTPGIGQVNGKLNAKGIAFIKNMPVLAIINESGEHIIDETKKHPPIAYQGVLSRDKTTIIGSWRFKKKVIIWKGLIPFWVSAGNGSFTMHKKDVKK